ncbi:hypothetical protein PIIN_00807 [Serendipita indica DSM 11827]|uniref:Uncharacterized protein n=1 Tax=Serendipita indica (strain DSM 11827) TaxID=1109443 RepID=G4T6M7_SERID|nr:hypothetical protein PIIN_00807 [Serendipita indica DSM 11827]
MCHSLLGSATKECSIHRTISPDPEYSVTGLVSVSNGSESVYAPDACSGERGLHPATTTSGLRVCTLPVGREEMSKLWQHGSQPTDKLSRI